MEIVDKGLVFEGRKNSNFQSCSFPQICVLPGGRWLCAFRACQRKSSVVEQCPLVTFSDNEGKRWSEPSTPFKAPFIDDKAGVFRSAAFTSLDDDTIMVVLSWIDISKPSLPFFNAETEGLLETRIFTSLSEDGGLSWSPPELLNTSPFEVPTPITGPILVLSDGKLACQFELNKHYYDTSVWRHSSVLKFSHDGGQTWPEHVITSNDPENRFFFWDQRPALLDDGRVLDLFWTYDNKCCRYVNIHARESMDNARTFSDMWDTGVSGQPSPAVSMPDGKIAMAYVDRSKTAAIKVRLSEDEGRSWPEESEITLHELDSQRPQTVEKSRMDDAWAEMAAFSLGLPATAKTNNGQLLVVYYAGPHTDKTDIYYAKVKAL